MQTSILGLYLLRFVQLCVICITVLLNLNLITSYPHNWCKTRIYLMYKGTNCSCYYIIWFETFQSRRYSKKFWVCVAVIDILIWYLLLQHNNFPSFHCTTAIIFTLHETFLFSRHFEVHIYKDLILEMDLNFPNAK